LGLITGGSNRTFGGDDAAAAGGPKKTQPKREGAKSFEEATNDLKRLALAVHKYHADYGRIPPAAASDKAANPTVSWRVLILPYIQQETLFKEFKLDEPWDSDQNKKLIAKMPAIFRGPSKKLNEEGKTVYLAPLEMSTLFPPDGKKIRFAQVYDGLSNTIMFVETNDDSAVVWTKPVDLPVELSGISNKPNLNKPMRPISALSRPGQEFFLAAMGDGSVIRFKCAKDEIGLTNLARAFSRDEGELIDYNSIALERDSSPPK